MPTTPTRRGLGRRQPPSGRRALIPDAAALKGALIAWYGSIKKAAQETGVPQPTLWRLTSGVSKNASAKVLARLRRAAAAHSPDRAAELESLFLTPGALSYIDAYCRWLASELRPIGAAAVAARSAILDPQSVETSRWGKSTVHDPPASNWFWVAVRSVAKHPHVGPIWSGFRRWMEKRAVEPVRQLVAMHRVLRPFLADVSYPWQLEIPLDDLLREPARAKTYFRAAIEAEKCLLMREPIRVRAVVMGDPRVPRGRRGSWMERAEYLQYISEGGPPDRTAGVDAGPDPIPGAPPAWERVMESYRVKASGPGE